VHGPDQHLLGTAHAQAGELIPTRLLSPIEIQHMFQSSPAPELASDRKTS
jgi:tRNA pseudouridine55 synthase